ncbi:hypothetical protein QE152_g39460 [Popillia japonica]|uniref:Uncharacterized protein n=1 Tax=Popillia japonica TaxID=7064 RepID=A0AAW1HTY6_POPJA
MSVSLVTVLVLILLSETQTKILANIGEMSKLNPNQELYLKELISKYPNYSFTIHYTKATADLSGYILKIINEKEPKRVLVNNLDSNKSVFKRSGDVIKTVNLVVLDRQNKFLNFSDNVRAILNSTMSSSSS